MTEQVRVLVVGAGSIGERHVRCFQETGRARVSLCEIDAEVRDAVAARYGLMGVFDNLESAIAEGPNAAVICTPAPLHVPMAIQLAEAGIHLLVEKPLSTSLQGVGQLERIVADRNLLAAVAYVYRANRVLSDMRQAIRDGRFGKPVQLIVVSGQHFPFYRPAYRDIYYNDRSTGGGAIQDALTHLINAGEWLIGPVTSLAADAAHQVLAGVDVEDTVGVIARHGSVLASYILNQHQAVNETSLTVVCSEGVARAEMHRHRWLSAKQPGDDWLEEASFPTERDELFINQANAFLDALAGKTEPLCTLPEGVQTLKVNLAVLTAAETRTWQTVSS